VSPRLRQAASPLEAMRASAVLFGSEKRQRDKYNKLKYRKTEKAIRMEQRYFIDSWLLPCSLRSHRTANPRPKMGFAIFRLCPPTTLIQVLETMRCSVVQRDKYQTVRGKITDKN